MKVTPALKKELAQWLDTYWTTYLKGDIETWATFLRDDYRNIGGTKEEIWNSKQEIIDYTTRILDQMIGTAEIRNREIEVIPYGEYTMVNEFTDLYVKIEGEWTFYGPFRMSSLLEKTDTSWIALHQHGSYPDMKAMEGEAFSVDAVKAENAKLLEAVKSRTLQLEIEAALERVRAVAMGMKKPEDMLKVCRIISDQLKDFGVAKIRNVQIAIIDENIGQYLCYQYFTPYNNTTIEKTAYLKSPVEHEMVRQMLASRDGYFIGNLSGNELEEFRIHRKEENHFPDPFLDKATELDYCFLSIGEGGLGLTLYQPMADDVLTLFRRFHQVFSLAYQRFRDIQKAEAQAREAQIEASLERVRARTMAMHSSDELNDVVHTLFTEFHQLGMDALATDIIIFNKDGNTANIWISGSDGTEGPFLTKALDHPHHLRTIEAWKNNIPLQVTELKDEYFKSFFELAFNETEGIKTVTEETKNQLFDLGRLFHTESFTRHGCIRIASLEKLPDLSEETLQRFAKVFDQTYIRFLDLQKAEAQAREAQIEVAVERVRAQSMAMHHPDDLDKVNKEILTQLNSLQIEGLSGVTFYLVDQDGWVKAWDFSSPGNIGNQKSYTLQFDFKKYEMLGYPFKIFQQTDLNYLVADYPLEKLERAVCEIEEINPEVATVVKEALTKGILTHQWSACARISDGILGIDLVSPPSEDTKTIILKIAGAFNQAYQRFLDLQKAEALAREARVEASLEKVRSRTMAMQKGEELKDVAVLLYKELIALGVTNFVTCGYVEIDEKINRQYTWVTGPGGDTLGLFYLPLTGDATFDERYAAWKNQQTVFHQTVAGEVRSNHLEYATTTFNSKEAEEMVRSQFPDPTVFYCFNFSHGYLHTVGGSRLKTEEEELLARFTKVFEQTYIRFLDLQKAEEQAREAQIEAALEKVRSRSLAMHSPNELGEVVTVIVEKLTDLGVVLDANGVVLCTYFDDSKDVLHWIVSPDFKMAGSYLLPWFDHPIFKEAWGSKERGDAYFSKAYSVADKNSFFEYAFEHSDYRYFPEEFKQWVFQNDKHILSFAWQMNSAILIPSHTGVVPTEDEAAILKRFAKVFEQAYVRFMDLQKAEAQARAAKIEAGLERARTQSMLMKHSDEIKAISNVFHEQLRQLGIPSEFSYVWLPDEVNQSHQFWASWSENKSGKETLRSKQITYPLDKKEPYTAACFAAWANPEVILEEFIPPSEIAGFFEVWQELLAGAKKLKPEFFPDGIYYSEAYMRYGCFGINIRRQLLEEEKQILKRFSIEFERAYTRFLDLQKAEAQAREAQIQLALERVRARTMAMQSSEELAEVSYLLNKQVVDLGIPTRGCAFNIYNELDSTEWFSNLEGTLPAYKTPREHIFLKYYEAGQRGETLWIEEFGKERIKQHYDYLHSLRILGDDEEVVEKIRKVDFQIDHVAYFKYGYLLFITLVPAPEAHEVFKRFAKEFEQTYTRFLDLKKAEAQAREAQIELSLEKIRAQVASMQESTDLLDIMVNIRSEFVALGHEAHYFWYMRWLPDKYEKAMTSGDGTQVGMIMSLPRHIHGDIPLVANWEKGEEPTLIFPMEVDTAVDYVDKMITLGDFVQVDPQAPTLDDIRHIGGLTFIMARTSQGEIGYSLPGYVPNPSMEAVAALARFAGVFDLAFKRFEDFKKAEKDLIEIKEAKKKAEEALAELKATQSQLVQQEKLASLGQLTAGIAHEIKNPLNFVNNFSEVSMEMIEETLEEMEKPLLPISQDARPASPAGRDETLIRENLEDIKSNLQKVHEHGSRANGIVTSMLQHSRGGSGKKEPTDLNALIKEYVNLSFHGMRAGKNPINVDIRLDLDQKIGSVNLIGEDFTRVVLNLVNNAFDAMREKTKTEPDYKPELSIYTRSIDKVVEISIGDNGPGIPEDIKHKILQPFFTTKKGTEGTGLGLSITHDIVKAHGGELRVETKDGEGSEFIIQLPVV